MKALFLLLLTLITLSSCVDNTDELVEVQTQDSTLTAAATPDPPPPTGGVGNNGSNGGDDN